MSELHTAASTNPLVLHLQDILSFCSKSIKGGDESSMSVLVDFLETVLGDLEEKDAQNNALKILSEIHRYLFSPGLDQALSAADRPMYASGYVASILNGLSKEVPF